MMTWTMGWTAEGTLASSRYLLSVELMVYFMLDQEPREAIEGNHLGFFVTIKKKNLTPFSEAEISEEQIIFSLS